MTGATVGVSTGVGDWEDMGVSNGMWVIIVSVVLVGVGEIEIDSVGLGVSAGTSGGAPGVGADLGGGGGGEKTGVGGFVGGGLGGGGLGG